MDRLKIIPCVRYGSVVEISPAAGRPRVFISYAHSSTEHVEAVRRFWELLSADGIDVHLDLPAATTRQDWPVWMMTEFRKADYILVIASAAYRRRAEGTAASDDGRGVQFEGALLRELLYSDRQKWFSRVLPIVLPGQSSDGIPIFLSPISGSNYVVTDLTPAGIEPLRRAITGRLAMATATRSTPDATVPHDTRSERRSRIAEIDALATALGQIRELADAAGRGQAVLLLPPGIREYIEDGPTTRLHLFAIVQGCARFGEAGRAALLDVLRHAFPAEDPSVERAIRLVEESWFFDDVDGR